MKLTVGDSDSEFGVPVGSYLAKFLGAVPREPRPEHVGRDGKPFGPGLEWQFEVLQGEHAGSKTSRTTSPNPTQKNSCGKMAVQISGGVFRLDKGAEFDPDHYVGRSYQVIVENNSTNTGTRVGSVMPVVLPGTAAPSAGAGGGFVPAAADPKTGAELGPWLRKLDTQLATKRYAQVGKLESHVITETMAAKKVGQNPATWDAGAVTFAVQEARAFARQAKENAERAVAPLAEEIAF